MAEPADGMAWLAPLTKPAKKIASETADGTTVAGKKAAAPSDEKIPTGPNILLVTPEAAQPLPSLLSLPYFSFFEATPAAPKANPTTVKKQPAENVLPVTNLLSAVTAATTTLKPAVTDLVGVAEKATVELEKIQSQPSINLAPATAPAGPAAPVLDGKVPTAEAKPDAKPDATLNGQPAPSESKIFPLAELAAAPAEEKAADLKLDLVPAPVASTTEQKAELNPVVLTERAIENAGTGVATTVLPMKNPPKTNKVAGPDVKVLPVGETGMAQAKTLPPQLLVTPVRAADNRGTDLNFTFSNGNSNAPVADSSPVLTALDLPSLADARMRAVERTHDMMALHSMRLVESKSDSLSVVIKPAVGTELSLELRQRDGGVEAQATLTRGDHQFLNQHWPELQQRLELRGIKLSPLGGETNFSANDNGNFQRQQAANEEMAQQASAFAEFASIGGATARLAPVHDGWESWA